MSSKRATKLDGAQVARLIAIARDPAPKGRARWTLRLLAEKSVEVKVEESLGREAGRQTLTT